MLTQADRHWHERYEAMSEEDQSIVGIAFDAAVHELRALLAPAHQPAMDDRAEALIAAITRYVVESRR